MADGESVARGARGLNIRILAVGRASGGPERTLCEDYISRARKAGRSMGISNVDLHELPDGRGANGIEKEGAEMLRRRAPGVFIVLDERGIALASEGFATRLQGWLEAGRPNVTFALGGANGHAPSVRAAADTSLSLSPMTLPHLLARVVITEQIYRAITICLGHPYHRG